jgi:hypothetical protein
LQNIDKTIDPKIWFWAWCFFGLANSRQEPGPTPCNQSQNTGKSGGLNLGPLGRSKPGNPIGMKTLLVYLVAALGTGAALAQPSSPSSRDTLASAGRGFSTLVVRLDVESIALANGRTFGPPQAAFGPSATYYHHSGLYGGISGSVFAQTQPAWNLTTFSAGYATSLTDYLYASVAYGYSHFNPVEAGLLAHSASASLSLDVGKFSLGTSYSYLFGQETAHRLSPSLAGYFQRKNLGFIDRLTFAPAFSATLGTENVPLARFTPAQFQLGTGTRWQDRRSRLAQARSARTREYFGLMAWQLDLPIRLRVGHFRWGVAYHYVVPVRLPNETSELRPTGYLSSFVAWEFGG